MDWILLNSIVIDKYTRTMGVIYITIDAKADISVGIIEIKRKTIIRISQRDNKEADEDNFLRKINSTHPNRTDKVMNDHQPHCI